MANCAACWRSRPRTRRAGEGETRSVVLVPESAHGTNPATAAFSATRCEPIPARDDGTRRSAATVAAALGPDVAAIMLTNPNTCGLFEPEVVEIAKAVHEAGAYFYCDGANFNAIVGKVRPGDLGVDAMHINLHKTFSTPHGGGGPGAGPVVLSEALAPFAPLPFVTRVERRSIVSSRTAPRTTAATPFGRLTRLPRPDGHVRARARLHAEPRRRWHAAGLRGCRAERQLHPRRLTDLMTQPFGDRPCMHEALFDDELAEGHGRHHARLRQGDDRRGLPPDDHVLPAGGARRDADRADRDRVQGEPRSLRYHAASVGRGGARPAISDASRKRPGWRLVAVSMRPRRRASPS